ncbi:conserved hypothetical protein [Neorickettsia risticii str. Illinois]|uniref:Uncharacterized protein n=1 Tax=Neorickettsia risticii (strain Illinois) TaxID=434131 RepID=C6V453_NEORI|nr:conserved hypothetical protein [Neorickettsia risticii str. Illinois]
MHQQKSSPHLVFRVFLSKLETVIAIVLLGVYNSIIRGSCFK